MSKAAHTPGPWVAHGAFYTHGAKGDVFAKDARDVYEATPICRVVAPVSHRQSKNPGPIDALHAIARRKEQAPIIEANAARIVACVNALEGIADPSVVGDAIEAATLALNILCHYAGQPNPGGDAFKVLDAALAKLEGAS